MKTRTRVPGRVVLLAALAALPATAQDLAEVDRPLAMVFDSVFTLGSEGGARDDAFGEIRSVAFDDHGRLYVLDTQAARISVADTLGRIQHSFGVRGEGPGEFRQVTGFAVLGDGRVAAQDVGHQAYLIFAPDGSFLESIPFRPRPQTSVMAVAVTAGRLFPDRRGDAVYEAGLRLTLTADAAGEAVGSPIYRVPLSRGGERTVAHTAWRPGRGEDDRVRVNGDGTASVRLSRGATIWEPGVHAAPLPDGGLAVVDSTTWTVALLSPHGGIRSRMRRSGLLPVPVTRARADAEIQRRLRLLEEEGPRMRIQLGNGRSLPQDQLARIARSRIEASTFYHEVPVITGLRASPEGLLWVQRANPDDPEDRPVDLVGWEGTYRGTIRGIALPDALGPGGLAAWIERGPFDLPRVSVRRAREGAG